MIIINLKFTNKKQLRLILKKLSENKYINTSKLNKKTIYKIQNQEAINAILQLTTNPTAIKIINITELHYTVTALFYGVRDNNHDSHIQIIYFIGLCLMFQLPTTALNETNIKKLICKINFIKQFLNNITLTLNTTTKQIANDYQQQLTTYKDLLQKKLQTITTNQTDSTITIDELMTLLSLPNNQRPTTNSDIQQNLQTHNLTDLQKKTTDFYSTDTQLTKYIKQNYISI